MLDCDYFITYFTHILHIFYTFFFKVHIEELYNSPD